MSEHKEAEPQGKHIDDVTIYITEEASEAPSPDAETQQEQVEQSPAVKPKERKKLSPCLTNGHELTEEELLREEADYMTSLVSNRVKQVYLKALEGVSLDSLSVTEGLAIMHNGTDYDDVRPSMYKLHQDEAVNDLTYGDTKLKSKTATFNYTGDIKAPSVARLKAFKAMGLTGRTSIMLLNSGFWITLEAIGDRELLDLEYRISESEVTLGRKTNGAIYSNDAIIYIEIIKEFVEENLIYSTLDVPLDKVFDYIESEDIDLIVTGIVYMLFPFGFDIRIPCIKTLDISSETKKPMCSRVYEFSVDPNLMLYGIGEKIKDKHLKQLGEVRPNTVTVNDIAEYKKNSYKESLGFVELKLHDETVKLFFKSPSVNEKIKSGRFWVNSITKQVDDIITMDVSDVDRALTLDKYGKQSRLNTYIHYIDRVEYADGSIVHAVEEESMLETLSAFTSSSQSVINTIAKAVNLYIKDKCMHVFGIPEYKCDACQSDNDSEVTDEYVGDIIPMDPLRVFFQLATVKREKSENKIIF